jgi:CHAT domain-containing protein
MLMQRFYQNWKAHPELGKSEALRQAQVAMLTGQLKPEESRREADRAAIPNQAGSPGKTTSDWSHPYYWAPFILLGNWK